MPEQREVHALFCNSIGRLGNVAMTVTEYLDWMRCPELEPRLWCHISAGELLRDYYRPVFGRLAYRLVCRARVPQAWMDGRVIAAALRHLRPGDVAYLWPPYDDRFLAGARKRGAVSVTERINCMGALCKRVLERAFGRHGRPLPAGWCLPEEIERERRLMVASDYVTAPGPFVTESLLEAGIPRERILETAQGWSPTRLASAVGVERPDRDPVFAFVGSGGLRKGLDLLLEAWERAEVRGTLLLAGRIEDDVQAACARQLALPSVKALGFVSDVAKVYAAADVFVFPTHEEGGPQVIYEAAACGLACLVSPMGAGRVVRHGHEGFVVDPFDQDAWVDALRTLARDAGLRRGMGAAAAASAQGFTWQRVSERLREHFLRLGLGSSALPAPQA